MQSAIAQHLNVTESAILEVQEWARVLWVRVRGIGARFVSKKVVKTMSSLINRSASEKQANYAQSILDRVNSQIEKMIAKLEGSDFFLFEPEPGTEQAFAKYVYKRLGVDTQSIIDSLHGDKILAEEKRTKLIAALQNMKNFLNEKATARFIIDKCDFGLGEVFVQTFKAVNKK